ncbi:MAG: LPS export ABC transporter permease LptF [Deltaproteobacteria bacterium]|nr:LPS export ABC transporter permease LptF [Deltaproteobacteria bacterium]
MKQRIIFTYILKELFWPFILGLSVFVFILVMSQMLRLNELIIVHGVGIGSVLLLLFYLLTSFLAISIPIALLFSVMMVFGRLSSDSEIIALRASGFSLFQLLKPVVLFALIICTFCLYLTIYLENWGARSYRSLIFQIGKNKASVGIKEGVFNDDFFGLVLYAQTIDSEHNSLKNIFIYDQREKNRPLSIVSETGYLVSSSDLPSMFLVLNKGSLHSIERDHSSVQKIMFDQYTINLSLDDIFQEDRKEKAKWLPLNKLLERSKELRQEGDLQKAREYESEFHRKFSMAFVSLIFAALGIALGIKPTRAVKSLSFIYTMIAVGVYWILYMNTKTLAISGLVPPALAMWLPNLLFGLLAGYLIYKTNRQ